MAYKYSPLAHFQLLLVSLFLASFVDASLSWNALFIVNGQISVKNGACSGLSLRSTASTAEGSSKTVRLYQGQKKKWDTRYEELIEYKQNHGDTLVPMALNKKLGTWVSQQRKEYRSLQTGKVHRMTQERLDKLDEMNFVWDVNQHVWDRRWEELREFEEMYGHLDLECEVGVEPGLSNWCRFQLEQHRGTTRCHLTEERRDKLESLKHWDWKMPLPKRIKGKSTGELRASWKDQYELLVEFSSKHGHCLVPGKFEENATLGSWVNTQRIEYNRLQDGKESRMTPLKIASLEKIGFVWDANEAKFLLKMEELSAFQKENGHVEIPDNVEEYKELSHWVDCQKTQYIKFRNGDRSTMTVEKISEFKSIPGFDFGMTKTEQWDSMVDELIKFKDDNGHCLVPRKLKRNPSLGNWVHNQRAHYKRTKRGDSKTILVQDKIDQLEAIGFCWDPLAGQWHELYDELVEFKQKNGHCFVPNDFKENPPLGLWVQKQRTGYKRLKNQETKKIISQDRIDLLDAIGFAWDPLKARWDANFKALEEYQKKFGDCKVPKRYKNNPTLANWVSEQRKMYRKLQMSQDRIDRLESIGFN